jgi:hypothetical protein
MNHQRLFVGDSDISCGVAQLVGVEDYESPIQLHHVLKDGGKGISFLFSDTKKGGGKLLARHIRKYKLGRIATSTWRKNPNSGNIIKTWIWEWNGKQLPKSIRTKYKPCARGYSYDLY